MKIRKPEIRQVPLACAQIVALRLILEFYFESFEENSPPCFKSATEPIAFVRRLDGFHTAASRLAFCSSIQACTSAESHRTPVPMRIGLGKPCSCMSL